MGIYDVFLRDDRGRDQSTFKLTDAGKVSADKKQGGTRAVNLESGNITSTAVLNISQVTRL